MNYNNETSHKIMKVALKLFSEKGYYPTTTREIASVAGVNELTLFRHFGSKSNLFQAATEYTVIDSQVDHILSNVQNLTFEESMALIARRIYLLYIKNTLLYKVQMKLADDEKELVKLKLSRKVMSVLKVYFSDLNEQNIVKGDPEIMAVTLINSLLGTLTVEILGENTFTQISWERLVEEHAKQFAALYKSEGEEIRNKQ